MKHRFIYHWKNVPAENRVPNNDRDSFRPPSLNQIIRQGEYIKDSLRGPETYFRLKDVPDEERRYWKRLKMRDEGWYSDNGRRTWITKYREMSAIISKLRLPKYQEKEAVALSMVENASAYSYYGGRPALALAVAVHVVNRERQRYDYFKFGDRLENDERFKEVVKRNDIDIMGAKRKYKRKQHAA